MKIRIENPVVAQIHARAQESLAELLDASPMLSRVTVRDSFTAYMDAPRVTVGAACLHDMSVGMPTHIEAYARQRTTVAVNGRYVRIDR